ncbi:8-oxoguanine deaminase, partial [Rhizobium ruizarguesonis]
ARHMTPEAFRLAVRLALTELLLSCCTTTSDHHYLYAAGLEDAMDFEAEEAARLGMRITLTRGSLKIKDQQGVMSPANVVQDD